MRFLSLKLFVIIFIFIFPFTILAQETVDVRLDSSTNEVAINDSFQLFVIFKNTNNYSLRLDNLNMPGLDKFQKIGTSRSSKTQIINGKASSVTEMALTLRPSVVGEFEIGPLTISSGKDKIQSNKISVKVKKEKIEVFSSSASRLKNKNKKFSSNYSKIMLNIFAFILLLYFIWRFYKEKDNKNKRVKKEQKEFQNGIEIWKNKIPNKDNVDFYKKIRGLLYEYLSYKYNLKTESLTTKELLFVLEQKHIPLHAGVREVLEICDRAHFAAQGQDKEELLILIKSIIT